MHANIHAILMIATTVVPIGFLIFQPGRYSGLRDREIVGALCVALVVLVFALLLLTATPPVPEAILCLYGCLILGLTKPGKIRVYLAGLIAVASVLLCLDGLILRNHHQGAIVSSNQPVPTTVSMQQFSVRRIARLISKLYPPEQTFEEGPVTKLLPEPEAAIEKHYQFRKLWHTGITGVTELYTSNDVLWYLGGEIRTASKGLYWKASPATSKAK